MARPPRCPSRLCFHGHHRYLDDPVQPIKVLDQQVRAELVHADPIQFSNARLLHAQPFGSFPLRPVVLFDDRFDLRYQHHLVNERLALLAPEASAPYDLAVVVANVAHADILPVIYVITYTQKAPLSPVSVPSVLALYLLVQRFEDILMTARPRLSPRPL